MSTGAPNFLAEGPNFTFKGPNRGGSLPLLGISKVQTLYDGRNGLVQPVDASGYVNFLAPVTVSGTGLVFPPNFFYTFGGFEISGLIFYDVSKTIIVGSATILPSGHLSNITGNLSLAEYVLVPNFVQGKIVATNFTLNNNDIPNNVLINFGLHDSDISLTAPFFGYPPAPGITYKDTSKTAIGWFSQLDFGNPPPPYQPDNQLSTGSFVQIINGVTNLNGMVTFHPAPLPQIFTDGIGVAQLISLGEPGTGGNTWQPVKLNSRQSFSFNLPSPVFSLGRTYALFWPGVSDPSQLNWPVTMDPNTSPNPTFSYNLFFDTTLLKDIWAL